MMKGVGVVKGVGAVKGVDRQTDRTTVTAHVHALLRVNKKATLV